MQFKYQDLDNDINCLYNDADWETMIEYIEEEEL